MSRMLRPDPGEMVDRQSILELKIYHTDTEPIGEDIKHSAGEKGKASRSVQRTLVDKSSLNSKQHLFLDEMDLIRKHLIDNWIPDISDKPEKIEEYDKLYDELSEVNSQLWDLEDQKRVLMKAPNPEDMLVIRRKAEISDCITTLNDKRSDLVRQVNMLWNINSQEKLYTS